MEKEIRVRRGRSRDWEDKAKRAHSRLLDFLGKRLSLEDIIAGNFYIGIPKDRVETPYIETSMGGWGKSLYMGEDLFRLQVQGSDGEWYYTARYMYKGCLRTCGIHLFNAVKYGSCSSSQFPELDEKGTFGTRIPNTGWSALTSYTQERLWRYYPTGNGHA